MRIVPACLAPLVAVAVGIAAAAPLPAATVGSPAPNFRMTLLDGTSVALADLRGQVVLLNFWATWCAPCKRELPLLDAYYKVKRDAGLRMFAVTTEDSVPVSRLQPLAAALAIPMVRRLSGGDYATVKAVPTTYVIDRAGVLRYAKAGQLDLGDLNDLLIPLLNEDGPVPQPAAATRASTAGR